MVITINIHPVFDQAKAAAAGAPALPGAAAGPNREGFGVQGLGFMLIWGCLGMFGNIWGYWGMFGNI